MTLPATPPDTPAPAVVTTPINSPPIVKDGQRRILIIVGQTGSGKTQLARAYLKDKTRVLIADADFREFGALDFTQNGLESLASYLKKYEARASFFKVSYTPRSYEYPLMCDIARVMGNLDFVIEEADRFPDPKWCDEYDEIISRGRHWGVSICAISRHPYAIPVDLRREASRIVAFRHTEPRDIDWLSDVIGEAAYEIPKLGDHEFIEWRQGQGCLAPRRMSLKTQDFC